MKEIQQRVDEWVGRHKMGYWAPADNLMRLVEEVGELAREINHQFGPKKKKEGEDKGDIALEMADIIFSVACLANSMNIDLDEAFERMMKKVEERDKDRWEKK